MTYITNPEKAYAFLKSIWPPDISRREKVMIVYMDRHFMTIGHEVLFVGGIDSCTMDTRIIFQSAVLEGAHSIMIAHNHPSGSVNPSKQDIDITQRLIQGALVLGLKVAHMVISRNDFHVLSFFE